MSLDFQSAASESGSGSNHVKSGVFVEEVRVTHARVRYSDYQLSDAERERLDFTGPRPDWDTKHDVCLDIGYKPEGRELSFTPEITLAGSFKWDHSPDGSRRVVGWNPYRKGTRGAEEIGQAIAALGITGSVKPDGTIPEDVLQQMVGRSALLVSYRSTQGKDTDLDGRGKIKRINALHALQEGESLDEARLRLADAFLSTYHMRGYPRDYDADDGGSGGDGLPAATGHTSAHASPFGAPSDTFEPDDDLPF